MLLAFDELDAVVDQIGGEVFDLLLGELDFLEPFDDLVVGEEPFLLPRRNQLLEFFDVGKSNVDSEHESTTSGLAWVDEDTNPTHEPDSLSSGSPSNRADSTSGFAEEERIFHQTANSFFAVGGASSEPSLSGHGHARRPAPRTRPAPGRVRRLRCESRAACDLVVVLVGALRRADRGLGLDGDRAARGAPCASSCSSSPTRARVVVGEHERARVEPRPRGLVQSEARRRDHRERGRGPGLGHYVGRLALR